MFYQSRFYDPSLGRFASPDTIIPESQGTQAWDRYAYVNNNPVNFTDPTGHTTSCSTGDCGADGSSGSDSEPGVTIDNSSGGSVGSTPKITGGGKPQYSPKSDDGVLCSNPAIVGDGECTERHFSQIELNNVVSDIYNNVVVPELVVGLIVGIAGTILTAIPLTSGLGVVLVAVALVIVYDAGAAAVLASELTLSSVNGNNGIDVALTSNKSSQTLPVVSTFEGLQVKQHWVASIGGYNRLNEYLEGSK